MRRWVKSLSTEAKAQYMFFLRPFRLPRFPYLIVLLIFINTRGRLTNITTPRQSEFEENVKRI